MNLGKHAKCTLCLGPMPANVPDAAVGGTVPAPNATSAPAPSATGLPQGAASTLRPAALARRLVLLWTFGIALLACSAVLSLLVGSRDMPLHEALPRIVPALRSVFDPESAASMPFDEFTVIIANLRVPRTILAMLAGVALGGAGAIFQGHTRNALADPGLLGVNAGAALAVVAGVYLGYAGSSDALTVPAIVGAALASIAVFVLSSTGQSAAHPLTLILAGTAITALLHAGVNAMIISDTNALDTLRSWATGSVAGRPLSVAGQVLPTFLLGLGVALAQGRTLNLLGMGEDTAASLGVAVVRTRILGLLSIALLAGAAVSAAGPVAFVGLAAPHAARMIWGVDYRIVIPGAMLLGGSVALWADVLGRMLTSSELPMGVVLGIVGVPLFVMLVKRGKVMSP